MFSYLNFETRSGILIKIRPIVLFLNVWQFFYFWLHNGCQLRPFSLGAGWGLGKMENDWCRFIPTYDEHNKIMGARCSFQKVCSTTHPSVHSSHSPWLPLAHIELVASLLDTLLQSLLTNIKTLPRIFFLTFLTAMYQKSALVSGG